MKLFNWTFFLLLAPLQVTFASNKIDLTLDLIEIVVGLGAELRAELKQSCCHPKVMTHNVLVSAMAKYAMEKGEDVTARLGPRIWFISAELIRTLATLRQPDRNYSVLDDLKVHFRPSMASKNERFFFYVCYELLAKIILNPGLDRKLVKASLDALLESDFVHESFKEDFGIFVRKVFEFLFPNNLGEKRKRPCSELALTAGKIPRLEASALDLEISTLDSTSESEVVQYFPLFYDSDSDSESKEEQDEFEFDLSECEESDESETDSADEISVENAAKILSNPVVAQNRREIKTACSVYLDAHFKDVEESILSDIFKIIRDTTYCAISAK
jgi:hypothetical protein